MLLALGIMAAIVSVLSQGEAERLGEYARQVVPARATLRATEVKRWFEGRDHWSAFGTFDIVAGDHRGRAEGSLIPSAFYRSKPRRYQVPQAEAAEFLRQWEVGRTYDGFWHAEYPASVFFDPVPAESTAQLVVRLRVAAVVLIAAAVLSLRFRP